jgi:hypothetical protein
LNWAIERREMARMITGNLRVIFFLAVLITSELELVHGYFPPENRYLPPTLGSTSVSPTFEIQPFELHDGSSFGNNRNFATKEVSGIKQSGARLVLQSRTRTATPYCKAQFHLFKSVTSYPKPIGCKKKVHPQEGYCDTDACLGGFFWV